MEITRMYKNSADETIRIDSIQMVPSFGSISRIPSEHTYRRELRKDLVFTSVDRVVDVIEIITDADSSDFNPSTINNYAYVEWTERNPTVRCNMSDLPVIGDTV